MMWRLEILLTCILVAAADATSNSTSGALGSSGTVYLIRHGEKDEKGCESIAGLKRADRMYDVFKTMFSLPSYIFAYRYRDGDCQRCKQTVEPIANKLEKPVDFTHGAHDCNKGWGKCRSFANAIKKQASSGPVLVAAEHFHIKYLAHDLGVPKDDIPSRWEQLDYDSVYEVTLSGEGATLHHKHQTKELVNDQMATPSTPALKPTNGSSGTIYVIRHVETDTPHLRGKGIGKRGKRHAQFWSSKFDGSMFKAPKTIIAGMVESTSRGQRMKETVIPLAKKLGVKIDLAKSWTPEDAEGAARKALQALEKGTVLVAWRWDTLTDLCKGLGKSCRDFVGYDDVFVFHVKKGKVESINFEKGGFKRGRLRNAPLPN